MAIFPFDDILTTFKNGTSRALRVVTENLITGGYSPANLTMQNAVTANGNGTTLNVNEYATAVLEIRGTFSATINFECSIDDTNWYPVLATKNDGIISSSCSTAGLYEIKVAAWKSIRARVSGYVSGNVTVVGKVSPLVNAEKSMQLTGSLPSLVAGSQIIGKVGIDQTTPGVTNSISVSTKKLAVAYSSVSQVLNVAASGGSVTVSITPPVGEFWRVKGLRFSFPTPAGSASGTHEAYVMAGTDNSHAILYCTAAYNIPIGIVRNVSVGGTCTPSTEATQQAAVLNLAVSNSAPLSIIYRNYTNASQVATVVFYVSREVEYTV